MSIRIDVKILPYRNHYGGVRKEKITKIVIHHVAGVMTAKRLGEFFAGGTRKVSANFGIGYDGSLGSYVPENMRAYTTDDYIDEHAITVEVSNSIAGGNWPISNKSLEKLIELCTYVCKKYGIKDCSYTGNKNGVLQMHKWYAATSCPGPYLSSKFSYISKEVNKRLGEKPIPSDTLYRVQVGAYKKPENALAMEKKLKAKGYDTYVIKVGELIKVQTGAFAKKDNALNLEKKLKADGFETYITTKGGTKYNPAPAPKPTIKKGSRVRVKYGAKDWNGTQLYDFVYKTTYTVFELSGNRAVIGINGNVTAAVHKDNLYLV